MSLEISEFFFNTPIYSRITVTPENTKFLREIFGEKEVNFNGYNPFAKLESTFQVITNLLNYNDHYLESGGFSTLKIRCKRTDDVFWFYILWKTEKNSLLKVGQYPSVADFHIYEIKQYATLLPKEKLKEFTRAIGLAANGVGIGSFVYLRRIFEHLIEEAYISARSESTVKVSDFEKARMDEKIDLLKDYLPSFLVENKGMYSILSLGIHELDERTCLAHFDTLRVGIEIILDEKLEEYKKKKKVEIAKKKLNDLKGQIKK